MAINLSLFNGVPIKRTTAIAQFSQIKREESKHYYNRRKWLILVRLKSGKYKGNYSTFIFSTKPKIKGIRLYQFPKK